MYDIWLSFLATRAELYLDLERMPLDPRGVWINESANPTNTTNSTRNTTSLAGGGRPPANPSRLPNGTSPSMNPHPPRGSFHPQRSKKWSIGKQF